MLCCQLKILPNSDFQKLASLKSSLSCVHLVIKILQLQFFIAVSNLLSCENTLDYILQLVRKDPNERLQSLGEIVDLDFIRNISLEQLVRREVVPKDYLKRRLPRTLARKSTNKKGREFLYDKIPTDFTVNHHNDSALLWQKEASDKSDISCKRAKCVCHFN